MSKLRVVLVASLLVLALGAVGCSSGAKADPSQLQGSWKLKAFGAPDGLRDANPDVTTSLTLENGKSSGNGGVNQFGGTYDAPGGNKLTFGPQRATMMAGDPAAMEQESEFFAIVEKTRHFSIENGELILESNNNDTLAVMSPMEGAAETSSTP